MGNGRHNWFARSLAGVIAVCILLLNGRVAHAARLLQIQVERDRQVALISTLELPDEDKSPDPATVWDYLKQASLVPVGDVPADPSDPLRATLVGRPEPIWVTVRGAGFDRVARGGAFVFRADLSTKAFVRELRLVRDSAESPRWRFAPGEIEALTESNGMLHRPTRWMPPSGVIAGAVVAIGIVIAWIRRRWPRAAPDAVPE